MAALPPYRLATLLSLRERTKDEKERALGVAMAELERQKARHKALEEELAQMRHRREQLRREYMDKAMRGQVGAQEAVRHNAYVEHLKDMEKRQQEAIAAQAEVVAEHERLVEVARGELVEATQELKALEKHREKWLDEVKKEIAAKEEAVMDDIAQTIYLRNEAAKNREGGEES